ncbi:MAG TPA: hypothetical protein VKR31_02630 [Rhizomicrobium sp.]|nr:hypothetical protein [Rhizomicrobium sp.]
MIVRTAVLSGAAAVAICTAALAQSGYDGRHGNGPRVSTPEEMQQTDQLNRQQTNDAASANATQIQYQGQYQDQLQQYNDQMQHYQAMQQRYRYDRARYNAYMAGYYLGPYGWDYPAPEWGYPPP